MKRGLSDLCNNTKIKTQQCGDGNVQSFLGYNEQTNLDFRRATTRITNILCLKVKQWVKISYID